MKSQKITLDEILKMDVKSKEFFEIYKQIDEKYWSFESPDDFQMAAHALHLFATRFEEDKIILCYKVIEQIMEMYKNKTKSSSGNIVFTDTQYYFDIYETEKDKDALGDMIKNAQEKIGKGDFKVKNSPFGKNHFKNKDKDR